MSIIRPLNSVLVGCGNISRNWLDAIVEIDGLRVSGLVDLDLAQAHKKAEEYHLRDILVTADLATALESTRPDLVFDCTVPEAHVDVTLQALEHGCHVLGEKPMADTPSNARKMVAAARRSGKLYAVMQNRRYNPQIRRLVRFLDSEMIGAITTVHSDFFIGAHFGGFRDRMQHALLLDMAIHTFDAARLLTRADPVSVFCKEWNPSGSWYDHGASAVAVFELTRAIVYTYRGSWCAEGLNTPWESEWRIIGERGNVSWDGAQGLRAQVVAEAGGFISKMKDVTVPQDDAEVKIGGHAGLIRNFVHCIRTGVTPETINTDNIKSLAMVFGAVESAERGKRVDIGPTYW